MSLPMAGELKLYYVRNGRAFLDFLYLFSVAGFY